MFQRSLPPMVKNLLIINVVMFVLTNILLYQKVVDLNEMLGLHYFGFSTFEPYQLFTHMFMHADLVNGGEMGIMHIFSNMLGLYMFGTPLEERLGSKRFLILYLVAGFGAAIIQLGAMHYDLMELAARYGITLHDLVNEFNTKAIGLEQGMSLALGGNPIDIGMVGASGCVFGLLAGFGMLFPNAEMLLLFLPIPIKAKYFVIIYGIFELYSGVAHISDGVAHFAHVGGAIFGFLLIKYWKSKTIL
ncbi:MAG: rhomboid family intramembrane serine protease [Flavobacteriales bacterium]